MGGKKSKPVNREELSPELQQMVDDVFKIFDKDGSKTIEKDEAVKHWSKNFGKISANEFFNTVDYNHDGQIQYHEFVDFWKIVKGSGHSEEEIQEELERIKNGESWIGFDDLPAQYMGKDKR
ncbi:ef hand family protein [Stylonychia lemnae]|uniref:Ef hand family protein n=1 Tax=Stylonychia lemnae TaxID=5949 RepID=A0A078A9W3_STYLE|nr:ef hand family protein [Stylonychia lemnae]|eukprot:CDW78974.1 ef hand family protein [Stylonychia lemnae]